MLDSSNLTFKNGKREDDQEEIAFQNQNKDDEHLASEHEKHEDTQDDYVSVMLRRLQQVLYPGEHQQANRAHGRDHQASE